MPPRPILGGWVTCLLPVMRHTKLVTLDGLNPTRGHFDRAFAFANALVVRPDRYVFGHTDETRSLDDLVSLLAQKLHLHY